MRQVAFIIDGGFYVKRMKTLNKAKEPLKVEDLVDKLVAQCLGHIQNIEPNSRKNTKKNYQTDPERLYRMFYYDCPPLQKKAHHPLTKKAIDFSKTETYSFQTQLHDELKGTRNMALRLGSLDERNARWKIKSPDLEKKVYSENVQISELKEEDMVYHAIQKGVDMKMGLDLATLAYKKLVQKIVIISGDSDLVPVLKVARREGIEIIIDAMFAEIKPDLHEHIDGLRTTVRIIR